MIKVHGDVFHFKSRTSAWSLRIRLPFALHAQNSRKFVISSLIIVIQNKAT